MLLDGNSLAFRAFYALPAETFKTQGGLTTNAVYGFTAMLINLLRDEAPTHVAAAFDVSRQTFRSDRYPEYKANRSATPDEFRGQIEITKEVLVALGITVLAEAGFEADDVIATLATQADAAGFRVLVVTGDRDALQLVTEDVTVLYPRKGVSELTRFTPEAVLEKYGLTPRQYPDFAALRGDPSDNLPGIPGVGEKTASKWIVEYGSLQDLVDNVDSVGGKVGDALRANLSHVVLNRELTDLVRDVPLAQTPDMLRMQPWDRDHIHRLFDDLEFRVLRDRLFDRWQRSNRRPMKGSTSAAARWPPVAWRTGWESTSPMAAERASRWSARAQWPTETPPRSRSPPPTANPPTSTPRR
jgi:DNA polymerase-1